MLWILGVIIGLWVLFEILDPVLNPSPPRPTVPPLDADARRENVRHVQGFVTPAPDR